MSWIVAIGDRSELAGYALAGVDVEHATDPDQVREAWRESEATSSSCC